MPKPLCIISAGYSFRPEDAKQLTQKFETYVINFAARAFEVDLPAHFCCLDHPGTFSQVILNSPAVVKHANGYHAKWLGMYPNVKTYPYEKQPCPKGINPFEQEKLQKPFLTFLMALQIAMRRSPEALYFYGCDFVLEQKRNYWFGTEIPDNNWRSKKQANDSGLKVFARWLPYMKNTRLVSLSKISKLNAFIEYQDLDDV